MSEADSPEKTTTHEEAVVKTKAKAETPSPQNTQPHYERKSYKTFWISSGIVVGILLILGLGITSGMLIENSNNKSTSSASLTSTQDGNTAVTQQESDIASVAEKVSPSVVSVVTQTQTQSYYGSSSGEAAGTGIIVSKDGYVMTNNHVIENASAVSVVDNDGNLYQNVSVIGRDPLNDIAFLKIKTDKTFTAATLGNSSTIRIGQQVVAIGNALGQYSNTVTSGIISGTGRPVTASSSDGSASETLTDLIQTDASINPGNSGGPLLNMSGQVIGINTAIVQDANGIGFAIPINSTKGVLAGVLETGKVSRAYLGVNYLSITADVARQYNLSVKQGAYVYTNGSTSPVASGSPAEQAGLKQGDVITKVNDISVGQDGSLSSIIGEFKPGDTVTLTFIRNGQTETTQVTFGTYQ